MGDELFDHAPGVENTGAWLCAATVFGAQQSAWTSGHSARMKSKLLGTLTSLRSAHHAWFGSAWSVNVSPVSDGERQYDEHLVVDFVDDSVRCRS